MATILIADDEPGMRTLIKQTLEPLADEGVVIQEASDGKQALEGIKIEKPDLILLDIMMPKMDGYDVCNTVKNELGMNDIYVLMLTANGQAFDKQRCTDAGVDYYITKPFNLDVFLEKVVNILKIEKLLKKKKSFLK